MRGKAQPAQQSPTTTPSAQPPTRWRRAFPYHWDVDDFVSRRQLLQWAVLTSGALFAGTAILAVLGWFGTRRRGTPRAIVRAQEVAEGEAFYFRYPEPDEQAMLLHLPGGQFVAYSQKCTHLACGVYYQPERDRLYCPCHEGVFDPRTGEPLAGPPQRRLPRIVLRRDGDTLIALEEVP
jgi:nitrite reductase/ring-hydroxylating ferredoxin subunit